MAAPFLSPGQVVEPDSQHMTNTEEEWRENYNVHLLCPECKEDPPNLIEETSLGDNVCGSCGLVLGERIVDTRSEWRNFANDDSGNDDPSRVGDVRDVFREDGLSTELSRVEGSKSARELYRAHGKTQDKNRKTLNEANARIQNICGILRVTDEDARITSHLFKVVDDSKHFKSKSTDLIIAGCLYLAFHQTDTYRTFKNISQACNVQKKDVGRMFKALRTFLSAQKGQKASNSANYGGINIRSFDAQDEEGNFKMANLVERYCNQLGIPTNIAMSARVLAETTMEKGILDGRSPLSGAAACIYMVSYLFADGKTAKEIAAVAGVSDGTIKNAYRFLEEQKDTLIKEEWLAPQGRGDITRLPTV